MLWLGGEDDGYVRDSLPFSERRGAAEIEETSPEAARTRFPQIDFAGVRTVFLEPEAGYLLARRACQAVAEAVAAEGGEVRLAAGASRTRSGAAAWSGCASPTARRSQADVYVFACGPWLGRLFPGGHRRAAAAATRQEVFYFGTPAGRSPVPRGRAARSGST